MPVSRNKRKDGKRHKNKRRHLSTPEIIFANLVRVGKIKTETKEEAVASIDAAPKEEHAHEVCESEGTTAPASSSPEDSSNA